MSVQTKFIKVTALSTALFVVGACILSASPITPQEEAAAEQQGPLCMNLSWTTAAATQFTLYMTISNLGRAASPLLAGAGLSHVELLGTAALLALAPVALLPFVDPEVVLRLRQAKTPDGRPSERSTEESAERDAGLAPA